MGALAACSHSDITASDSTGWILIDDFEMPDSIEHWSLKDTKNETSPRIERPQVTEVRREEGRANRYLIKKPAPDGVAGNRKALSYRKLPVSVKVGETYTFYTRINIEYFPNNHMFGLSNLQPQGIDQYDYDAFEPTLRVTDKFESDGTKNDGTLMVRQGKKAIKIYNFDQGRFAEPLQTNTWYEIWYVVNNARVKQGGQRYDVYLRGGEEFPEQVNVFKGADFRMKRERSLGYFLMNCNTGPIEKPYGNGGLRYDDLYMGKGVLLGTPNKLNH